jgi:hypothetical protein
MTPTFEKYTAKFADPLLLVGRLLLALIFLHESITLIGGFTAASAYVAKLGVPRSAARHRGACRHGGRPSHHHTDGTQGRGTGLAPAMGPVGLRPRVPFQWPTWLPSSLG